MRRPELLRSLPSIPRLATLGSVSLLIALVAGTSLVLAEPAGTDSGRVRILLRIPELSVRESWYDEERSEACLSGPESDMPVLVRELPTEGEGSQVAALGCDDVRVPVAPRGADEPILLRIEPL